MKAKHAKELRGINTVVDESRKAFQTLKKIIEGLRPVAMRRNLVSVDDLDTLVDCLQTVERYLKTHFVYNLEEHSDIATHCITYACSDELAKDFHSECKKPHTEKCQYCELFPLVITTMRAILEELERDMEDKFQYTENLHDLLDCHEKIQRHISYIIMNEKSNVEWNKKFEEMKPGRVMVTGKFNC